MDAEIYILNDSQHLGSPDVYWTLILTEKGRCYCTLDGTTSEYGKGIIIFPTGSPVGELSYSPEFKGSIIQIPDKLVTGSRSPVSPEFIRKIKENQYLDFSSADKTEEMRMAINYWFLIKEALADFDNIYSRYALANLCTALMKFCERQCC